MGLPVISTLFNGACEYMTQDLHGHILTDPKLDTAHLAQAIRSLAPPSARSRASEACLSLRPQLSIHHHVDQLLRLYLGVKKVDQQTKNR
jgi:glycosyltransferase involved in cell wall biosynthesis